MWWKKRWKVEQLAQFAQQTAGLLENGVPLLDALDLLHEQQLIPSFLYGTLKDRLQRGERLSDALRVSGFPALFVSFIRAAEEHGDYSFGFRQCDTYYSARSKWIRDMWRAILYPAVVFLMVLISFLFLTSVVLPRFADLYRAMGIPLPLATRWLFAVRDHWYWPAGVIGTGIGMLLILHGISGTGSSGRREAWEKALLRIPVIGDLRMLRMTQYVSVQLGSLLNAGVPLRNALELVERETPWVCLSAGLRRIRMRVESGSPLHLAIREEAGDLFLPSLPRLVALAESIGSVNNAFLMLARETEAAITSKTEKFTRGLEPLLIFGVGLLIAAMVIALFLPMLQMVRAL
ncbi:type II secretion system F family protein [Staphylospora marina]|uniref:type II secretion system F family protein n=1 Tax=Staphylospora marina TaxID=2490858 RepID=UPI000F5BF58E|nr:type II secretion system F family protein [Staphylospora marina]